MDQPLVRLAQAYGLIEPGTHDWPDLVDEDIADFISSSDPRSIFVVKQNEGLAIGPPPRSSEDLRVLVIAKPRGALSAQNWDQQVVSAALPLADGALFNHLHALLSQILLPLFDSQAGAAGAQARHRMVEAERALAQLLRHTQVAFVDMSTGAIAAKAQKALKDIETAHNQGLDPAPSDLNELQSAVLHWKKQVAQLAATDRDVQEGSVSDEIGFWAALEAALQAVQGQLASPLVTNVWKTLEENKRFHATHNFDGETGLTENLARVQGYTQLLFRDMPIGELLAATTLDQLVNATETVFVHLNRKLRASGYPAQRSIAFVEAIGRDFYSVLCRIVESTTEHIFDEAETGASSSILTGVHHLKKGLVDAVEVWDTQVRDFASVARDLMRKRNERFVVVKVETSNSLLVARISALDALCCKHFELLPLLAAAGLETSSLQTSFNEILVTKSVVQLGGDDWTRLETSYYLKAQELGKQLAEAIKTDLSQAEEDEQELYDVFLRNQKVLSRPEVRAVAHRFQTKLLETARQELRAAEKRAREMGDPSTGVVDYIVRMQQLRLRAVEIRRRLAVILGPDWKDHREGAHIGSACEELELRLDIKKELDAWCAAQLSAEESYKIRHTDQPASIFSVQDENKLVVSEESIAKSTSLKALRGLGFRLDPAVTAIIDNMINRSVASTRLSDCLASLENALRTISQFPRLKDSSDIAGHSRQILAFVRLGLTEMAWDSPQLSEFVYGFENALEIAENKIEQLALVDAQVSEELSQSEERLPFLEERVKDILLAANSPSYCQAVDRDLRSVVRSSIAQKMREWNPSRPKHSVELRNRLIVVTPSLSGTLQHWLEELNAFTDPVKQLNDGFVIEYAQALSKIRDHWQLASSQVNQWFRCQPLWDLSVTDTLESAAGNLELLSELLEDLRVCRDDSLVQETAIELDFSNIRNLFESKCEMWQGALLKELSQTREQMASKLLAESRAARKNLEASKIDLSALLASIKYVVEAGMIRNELQSNIPSLVTAEVLVKKLHYHQGADEGTAASLQSELTALELILGKKTLDLQNAKPRLVRELESNIATLVGKVDAIRQEWLARKPVQPQIDPQQALKILLHFSEEVQAQQILLSEIREAWLGLEKEKPLPFRLQELTKEAACWLQEISMLQSSWSDIKSVWQTLDQLGKTRWFDISYPTLLQNLDNLEKQIEDFAEPTKELKAYSRLHDHFKNCVDKVDVIRCLRQSEAVKLIHLARIVPSIAASTEESLCLKDVWLKLPDKSVVMEVVKAAEAEFQLLKYIEVIGRKWKEAILDGRDGVIHNFGYLLQLARDNQAALSAMRASQHFPAVAASVQDWERRVGQAQLIFDLFVDAQQQFVYLRGILTSSSVIAVLPNESKRFKIVAEEFSQIYNTSKSKPALEVSGAPRLSANLSRLIGQFASLHKSLVGFTEMQRQRFPRLYFVGDDDLLEIVGTPIEAWEQKSLSAIFPGIARVSCDHSISHEGEQLQFVRRFQCAKGSNNIDNLIDLESILVDTLQKSIDQAVNDLAMSWRDLNKFGAWLSSTPLQAVLVSLREQWTRQWKEIKSGDADLQNVQEEYRVILQWVSNSGDKSMLWSRRREAVIAELTHAQSHLVPEYPDLLLNVELQNSSSGRKVILKQGPMQWPYGYEYLGASDPIVRTKITDELFFSATTAISQAKGMSIIGSAGTGKTESVKALGAFFGRRVVVFNCDDKFDFLSVKRIMSGCAATKTWACFDEFNRLSKGVLSSVAQLTSESVKGMPVFVTMNPGYAGRTVLPANMRQRFREFYLEHPDANEIARVLLCAHGRITADQAHAAVELLNYMANNASSQRHYDWGLRALKGIIRVSRLLEGRVHLACRVVIRPRLVQEDQALFDSKIRVLASTEESDLNGLEVLLQSNVTTPEIAIEPALQPYVESLKIFIQLFPGVMLYGPCGCGKSTVRRMLAEIEGAETVVVDPTAISKSTLIGELDPLTREWKDGLISRLIRRIIGNLRGERNKVWFLVFDGEIEPGWAEALNSLLDENRHLSLASGEILTLPPQLHIIFETNNLNSATLATVSRCGMICIPALDSSESSIVPVQVMKTARGIHHSLNFVESGISSRMGTLNLNNKWLSMTWVLAGDSDAEGRSEISDAIRKYSEGSNIPAEGSLTDYYVSDLTSAWHLWSETVADTKNLPEDAVLRPEIVIPTAETLAHETLLQAALESHIPLLLIGPPGSGKTMTLLNALRQTDQGFVIPLNFSSTTTPEFVIQALEMHCEMSPGPDGTITLNPPGSQWAVLFIDEINLPLPKGDSDVVPVLQFLRYMIENKGYLDSNGTFVKIERIQIVGACNPPPMRRNLPMPLLRHFLVLRVGYPSGPSLRTIYGSFMSTFGADGLLDPMLSVFDSLSSDLPDEIWTPRELTRWMRGIYVNWTSTPESKRNVEFLAEQWIYEACRVLGDRLQSEASSVLYELLAENYPFGLKAPTLDSLNSKVWTNLVAQRPKFISLQEFRQFLTARLTVFADEASAESDNALIVHDEFAQHISRIERVLRQPQGHLLLVGPASVGKSTAVRFVAWLTGLELEVFRTHSQYNDSDFAQDLRKVLLLSIRRQVCVLLGEEFLKVPEFVEKMNSLLANGEVPGLFDGVEQMAELEEHCKKAGFDGGDIVPWFRSRIVQNIHVIFTTSNISQASSALLNRCVVSVMNQWSHTVERQIAEHWCSVVDVQSNVINALSMTPTLDTSGRYPNGCLSYIEVCRQFVRLYNKYKFELEDLQRHFVSGSERLRSTVLEIGQLNRKLAAHRQQLTLEDKRSGEVLSHMLQEQSEAERKRVAAIEIKAALQAQSQDIEGRQLTANENLAKTEPLIRQAAEGVQNIKKSQLNELRSMMNPPGPVKITLEAVCFILGLRTDGSWRQVLAAVRGDEFIPRIVNFDSGSLTPALISRIEQEYVTIPDFTYERVDRASKACGPLFRWVVAQAAYGRAIAAVKPLMEEIEILNEKSRESRAQLSAIESMLEELEVSIERSKNEYGKTVAQCELLKSEMQTVNSQLQRAETLLESLSDEKERWEVSLLDFPRNLTEIPGKAFLESVMIAVSGKLDSHEKTSLIHGVQDLADANAIDLGDDLVSLTTTTDTNQWVVDNSWTVPLVIDSGGRWDPASFSSSNLKLTTFLLDPDSLSKEIESALRFGLSLVIQNAERFDPLIMPILNRRFKRKGTRLFVNLGAGDIDVAPNFRLLLHARDIQSIEQTCPLLLSRVNIVDYSVTQSKFERMVSDALLSAKKPDLAKRRSELHRIDKETSQRLRSLEHKLLTVLSESSTSGKLLEDQVLLHSLEKLKAETNQLKEVQDSTTRTLDELESTFAEYLPQAKAAASIYESLKSLPELDRFYTFGVGWLWDLARQIASEAEFLPTFTDAVRSRVMTVVRAEHWPEVDKILGLSASGVKASGPLTLIEVIEECPPSTPVVAGLASVNTADPADSIVARNARNVSVVAMGSAQSSVRADRFLSQAMELGEWLIVQNIEIANEEWLRGFSRRLQTTSPASGFRLIFTGLQPDVAAIPDLLVWGRGVTVERKQSIKAELLGELTPESSEIEFMVYWVHACLTHQFLQLELSSDDLQTARFLIDAIKDPKDLVEALIIALWAAKAGSLETRKHVTNFAKEIFQSRSGLPDARFYEWASRLPDDPKWLPQSLPGTITSP